jgi:hypothetical protein
MRKRISRLTETLPWYLRLCGVMIGASIPAKRRFDRLRAHPSWFDAPGAFAFAQIEFVVTAAFGRPLSRICRNWNLVSTAPFLLRGT